MKRLHWLVLLSIGLILVLGFVTGWKPFFHLWLLARSLLHHQGFPAGIVIHHTASAPTSRGRVVDASFIEGWHRKRFSAVYGEDGKAYHIAYHYVILQDGTVQSGRPEYLPGAHTKGHPEMLGIVLVGNFERASNRGRCGPLVPPRVQLLAAARITRQFMAKYHLSASQVFLHRELTQTACPGDCFPRNAFFLLLAKR